MRISQRMSHHIMQLKLDVRIVVPPGNSYKPIELICLYHNIMPVSTIIFLIELFF